MPIPLASLPKSFGLNITDKPFFPYLFNKKDNYGKILSTLPPMEDYLCNSMSPVKRRSFDEW